MHLSKLFFILLSIYGPIFVYATPLPESCSGKDNSCAIQRLPRGLFGLFKRASGPQNVKPGEPEFIGFHGTNSATAELWTKEGKIVKPQSAQQSIWDFLGLGGGGGSGSSGANAELGEGLYITDDPMIAEAFANGNASKNKGTKPIICRVFAKSSDYWRNHVSKAWIPEPLMGDCKSMETAKVRETIRREYLEKYLNIKDAANAVKFGPFDKSAAKANDQLLLPSSITANFQVKCVPTKDPSLGKDFRFSNSEVMKLWGVHPALSIN